MRVWKDVLAASLLFCFLSGCVTKTEQRPYRPYTVPKEESLSQELHRVFGRESKPRVRASQEPFYKRFAKSITRMVGGPFHEEASTRLPREALRQQVEKEQTEALRKFKEQNTQD